MEQTLSHTTSTNDGFLQHLVAVTRPFLQQCRHPNYFLNDNHHIYYEDYWPLNTIPIANIIIVHGYCGFTGKYEEMIEIFLRHNFRVLIFDHFGHGKSERHVDNLSLVDVPDYQVYVNDLAYLIEQIAYPALSRPIFLFGHSMGGAITSLYLAQNQNTCRAAVLSAPMLAINFGKYPIWLIKFLCRFKEIFRDNLNYMPGAHDFTAQENFAASNCSDYNHYKAIFDQRVNNPLYQTNGGSWRWLQASLKAMQNIEKMASTIQTPLLILQAELDSLVDPTGLENFQKLAHNCKIIKINDTKHEIYNARVAELKIFYQHVLDFFNNQLNQLKGDEQ